MQQCWLWNILEGSGFRYRDSSFLLSSVSWPWFIIHAFHWSILTFCLPSCSGYPRCQVHTTKLYSIHCVLCLYAGTRFCPLDFFFTSSNLGSDSLLISSFSVLLQFRCKLNYLPIPSWSFPNTVQGFCTWYLGCVREIGCYYSFVGVQHFEQEGRDACCSLE